MREQLSYSQNLRKVEVEQRSAEAAAAQQKDAIVYSQQREKDLEQRNITKYLPSQIVQHPAYQSTVESSQTRMASIFNDLATLRAGAEGEVSWGTPVYLAAAAPTEGVQANNNVAAEGTNVEPENEAESRPSQINPLANLERGFAGTGQLQELPEVSHEERQEWSKQKEEVLEIGERLKQRPDCPPYNLPEEQLQDVLSRIGDLRARSRSPEAHTETTAGASEHNTAVNTAEVQAVD